MCNQHCVLSEQFRACEPSPMQACWQASTCSTIPTVMGRQKALCSGLLNMQTQRMWTALKHRQKLHPSIFNESNDFIHFSAMGFICSCMGVWLGLTVGNYSAGTHQVLGMISKGLGLLIWSFLGEWEFKFAIKQVGSSSSWRASQASFC
jgi:hypothetical protein